MSAEPVIRWPTSPQRALVRAAGLGVQGWGGILPVSADVCCLVEEVGAWQLR